GRNGRDKLVYGGSRRNRAFGAARPRETRAVPNIDAPPVQPLGMSQGHAKFQRVSGAVVSLFKRSSAGFLPVSIDMAAGKCVHDGRTEITDDESPRSPDKKRDQEKSEPKRDTAPYTWHRPEAAKRQDRKEQGDDRTQCSEKHRIPSANISSSYPRRRFGYGR